MVVPLKVAGNGLCPSVRAGFEMAPDLEGARVVRPIQLLSQL